MSFAPRRGNMIISSDEKFSKSVDSFQRAFFERRGPKGEIFRFLYSIDSLQDSLRVKEIDSACRIALKNIKFLCADHQPHVC